MWTRYETKSHSVLFFVNRFSFSILIVSIFFRGIFSVISLKPWRCHLSLSHTYLNSRHFHRFHFPRWILFWSKPKWKFGKIIFLVQKYSSLLWLNARFSSFDRNKMIKSRSFDTSYHFCAFLVAERRKQVIRPSKVCADVCVSCVKTEWMRSQHSWCVVHTIQRNTYSIAVHFCFQKQLMKGKNQIREHGVFCGSCGAGRFVIF